MSPHVVSNQYMDRFAGIALAKVRVSCLSYALVEVAVCLRSR